MAISIRYSGISKRNINTMTTVRIANGHVSFFQENFESEDEEMDADENGDVGECGWSWNRNAFPSKGILKRVKKKEEMCNGSTSRRIVFSLTPEQEKAADRPYRESHEEAKAARQENKHGKQKHHKSSGKHSKSPLEAIFSERRRDLDISYLPFWTSILKEQLEGFPETGQDPRVLLYKDEESLMKLIKVESDYPNFSKPKFIKRFKRLFFAPGMPTP